MLIPMFVMFLFTMLMLCLMGALRFRSVRIGDVAPKYYRLMSGSEVPEYIAKTSRHVSNLFETPILFYTAGILHIVMQTGSQLALVSAWAYVGFRFVHASIHLSYNHPLHRLAAFTCSLICIFIMWIVLVVSYCQSP